MTSRTRFMTCVAISLLWVSACGPSTSGETPAEEMGQTTPDMSTPEDMTSREDMGPDMAPAPDMSAGDMGLADAFAFHGASPLTPGRVSSEEPASVLLTLDLEGEIPEGVAIEVTVDGVAVEVEGDLSFTPPARPGRPGEVEVVVTIGETSHVVPGGLVYVVPKEVLELADEGRRERALPGVGRVVAAWPVDSDGDGKRELLVLDRLHAEEGVASKRALGSKLHHFEEDDAGEFVSLKVLDVPEDTALLGAPTRLDLDGDGVEETLTLGMRRGILGSEGMRIQHVRVHSGSMSDPVDLRTFSADTTVLDAALSERIGATGEFDTLLVTIAIEQKMGADPQLVLTSSLKPEALDREVISLPGYDLEALKSGAQQVRLVYDETSEPGTFESFLVGRIPDKETGDEVVYVAPATSHNASRSNRSSGISFPGGGSGQGGDCDGDGAVDATFGARIMDRDNDGVGDLIVASGCPENVSVVVTKGADVQQGDLKERVFSGATTLLEAQRTGAVIHALAVRKDRLTGVASSPCDAMHCPTPYMFSIPVDLGAKPDATIEVASLREGNPLHTASEQQGASVLYEDTAPGQSGAGAGGVGGFTGHFPLDGAAEPYVDPGHIVWTTSHDHRSKAAPHQGSITQQVVAMEDLGEVTALDSAQTDSGRLILAAVAGEVTLHKARAGGARGGALISRGEARVVLMRCEEQPDWTKRESACASMEVVELTPPDTCFWNGHVSLRRERAKKGTRIRAGIVREEAHKMKIMRLSDDAAMDALEDVSPVAYEGTEGDLLTAGKLAYGIGKNGQVVVGDLDTVSPEARALQLSSTSLNDTIKAALGAEFQIVKLLPTELPGCVEVGLLAQARGADGRSALFLWTPSQEDGGHTRRVGNAQAGVVARASSLRDRNGGLFCGDTDHFIIHVEDDDATASLSRIELVDDGSGGVDVEVSSLWPDGAPEGVCAGTLEECDAALFSPGDLDGDGAAELVAMIAGEPVLFLDITRASPEKAGPISWMSPESIRGMSAGAGAQAIVGEDGEVHIAPPFYFSLDGGRAPMVGGRSE